MQTPASVYGTLMASSVVRTPTAEQLRTCLETIESKRLEADHSLSLFGGNRYWCEALAKLPSRGPYMVRYNPDDATAPVAVYDGDRFVCEAPLYSKAGFRDQEAAKTHIRARNAFKKAVKAQARAMDQQTRAASWVDGGSTTPVKQPGATVATPTASVPQLVTTLRRSRQDPPSDDGAIAEKLGDAIRARRAREGLEDQVNDWGRRAAGAR